MRNHSLCLSELFESCLEIARHPKCEGKGVLGLCAGETRSIESEGSGEVVDRLAVAAYLS